MEMSQRSPKTFVWVGIGLMALTSALIFPVLPIVLHSLAIALGETWKLLADSCPDHADFYSGGWFVCASRGFGLVGGLVW